MTSQELAVPVALRRRWLGRRVQYGVIGRWIRPSRQFASEDPTSSADGEAGRAVGPLHREVEGYQGFVVVLRTTEMKSQDCC